LLLLLLLLRNRVSLLVVLALVAIREEEVIGELDLQRAGRCAVELERPPGTELLPGTADTITDSGRSGGREQQRRGGEGDEGEDGAEQVRGEQKVGLPEL
jgi:hypothetical protein